MRWRALGARERERELPTQCPGRSCRRPGAVRCRSQDSPAGASISRKDGFRGGLLLLAALLGGMLFPCRRDLRGDYHVLGTPASSLKTPNLEHCLDSGQCRTGRQGSPPPGVWVTELPDGMLGNVPFKMRPRATPHPSSVTPRKCGGDSAPTSHSVPMSGVIFSALLDVFVFTPEKGRNTLSW